jgi:amino acid transporter
VGALKRMVLGRPIATESAHEQLLPKILALPVFASDALSSVAYATEEIMLVLVGVSLGALTKALPISIAVAILMVIVVISYRQTVHAYPGGGGAYIVSKENLGELPGLIAAAALLTDYILTVAVSIAAGAFAIGSLVPSLLPHLQTMALIFLALITIANLRGVKESGTLFAIPTYAFVFSVLAMVAIGVTRCTVGTCPQATSPGAVAPGLKSLSLFLILRAFASGSTALTGVEAIANGVPAFRGRRPADQANNAASTLGALGLIAITMFVGITWLAIHVHARPGDTSVVSQVARAIFGKGFMFGFVQISTALILVLAANTAYQDFPRLSSILARDRYMPRQFVNRGDRLVFSNGIFVLATIAGALLIVYKADVSRLIQLYVVGVFTSFTLSQYGMVRRWRRLKPKNWQRNAVLNGIGAVATGVVLVVVAWTKFMRGAYLVIIAVPLIVAMFKTIHRHYLDVGRQLRVPEDRPARMSGTRAIVLVARIDEAAMRAIGYARALRPLEVRAMHVGRDEDAAVVRKAWAERRLTIPLDIVPGDADDVVDPVRSYIRGFARPDSEALTIVLPELQRTRRLVQFFHDRRALILKTALLFERNVVLTDVPVEASGNMPGARGYLAPTRVIAVVLVSAVHNATLRALEYARTLSPTDLRAVTFNVDPDETRRVMAAWHTQVDDVSLEAIDSPYREVTKPIVRYARQIRARNPDAVVSVIIPEFVVRKLWHQTLHNQTPLAIKQALLFEPGVVVTSVPFHLD